MGLGLGKITEKNRGEKRNSWSGSFYLYESYGFPLEILEEMAEEQGKVVNQEEFRQEFEKHQEISRIGQEKKFGGHGINTVANEQDKIKITKLHTATHLLLAALRTMLGPQIEQRGSDITPERLRLDFPFARKLTVSELQEIESLVNQMIQKNLKVEHYETTYEEALSQGVIGTFKDRYPEKVIVYELRIQILVKLFRPKFALVLTLLLLKN